MSTGTEKSKVETIAIGRFDGLHRGHQALFSHLGTQGALVVIETHLANLTPDHYRQKHTSYPIFSYNLDEIKELGGEAFIALLRDDFPLLKKIIVGEDFCFGKNRSSNVDDLKHFFPYEVVVVKEVYCNGMAVHAKTIRKLLVDGDVAHATCLLGYPYEIYGTVIKGQGLGRQHFVPTLNLTVTQFLLPASGIYVTHTKIKNELFPSVSFIGHRLSTDGNFCVETHLLDTHLDVAPNEVAVIFLERIRENRLFEDFTALKCQIDQDIKMAKEYFLAAQK